MTVAEPVLAKVQADAQPGVQPSTREGGLFLIDKPEGRSSFAIVKKIRYLLGIKKVGHAGTLDPFATGLLLVCVGRPATRCIDQFMTGAKAYTARLQLGVETETQDPEGRITRTSPVPLLTQAAIEACLQRYLGPQLQAPPPYSAAKHQGRPLYSYARKGVLIEKAGKPIEIYSLACTDYDPERHTLDIALRCSRGTYVRVLGKDIGRDLGCGAHLLALRRTACGPFSVDESLPGSVLFEESALAALQATRLDLEENLARVRSALL